MDLKEEDILGEAIGEHWYYFSKARAISALVGNESGRILDIGAGSGFFSKHLLDNTNAVEALCVDINYPAEYELSQAGKTVSFRTNCSGYLAQLLLFNDVLEHVEDDLGLLETHLDQLSCGGRVLITVPAFSFLWSGHDVFLEHKRRYTLSQVESLVESAGLTVDQGCYYFGSVFPLAAAIRLYERVSGGSAQDPKSQLKQHSGFVNLVLKSLCSLEIPFLKFNRLMGLSVCCVARKP